MPKKKKEETEIKVHFEEGCFDHFEGTQEELDELVKEIQDFFTGKSPEELEAMSRPLDDESFEDLPEEVQQHILSSISDQPRQRKLN